MICLKHNKEIKEIIGVKDSDFLCKDCCTERRFDAICLAIIIALFILFAWLGIDF